MKRVLVLALLLCAPFAHAQNTVPTAPPGTCTNQIASTAFVCNATGGSGISSWTTATRPTSPTPGQSGFNTTTGRIERFTGNRMVGTVAAATAGAGCVAAGTSSTLIATGTGGTGAMFEALLKIAGGVVSEVILTKTGIYTADPTLNNTPITITGNGNCTTDPTLNVTVTNVWTTTNENEISAADFGCIGDNVADDTNCLNLTFAYARSILFTLPAGTTPPRQGVEIKIPFGTYFISGPLNWTGLVIYPNQQNVVINASGATISCWSLGQVCIDMLSNTKVSVKNLQIAANCSAAPRSTVGLQLGRVNYVNADNMDLENVFASGCATLGMIYNMGSELNYWKHVFVRQFSTAPALILDGVHFAEFANGPLFSKFQDITLAFNDDDVFFNDFVCDLCSIYTFGTSATTSLWAANPFRMTFRNSYIVNSNSNIQATLFTGVGAFTGPTTFDLYGEPNGGAVKYNYWFTSAHTPFIQVNDDPGNPGPTINNPGGSCTSTGTAVLTGTTGTGTKFIATAQANSGAGISGTVRVINHGNYSIAPGTPESVTSTRGCTGVILNITSGTTTVNANPIFTGVKFTEQFSFSTISTFGVDASISTLTMQNAEISISGFTGSSGPLFDTPSKYFITGDVYLQLASKWSAPGDFYGCLTLGSVRGCTSSFVTVYVPSGGVATDFTHTFRPGLNTVRFAGCGPGGGGGSGSKQNAGTTASGGSGGGGGGCFDGTFRQVDIGSTARVRVGAGGAGGGQPGAGPIVGVDGTSGVGLTCVSSGATCGGTIFTAGGAGGRGAGGQLTTNSGGGGGGCPGNTTGAAGNAGTSAVGGAACYGLGGAGGYGAAGTTTTVVGIGGGGGGGVLNNNGALGASTAKQASGGGAGGGLAVGGPFNGGSGGHNMGIVNGLNPAAGGTSGTPDGANGSTVSLLGACSPGAPGGGGFGWFSGGAGTRAGNGGDGARASGGGGGGAATTGNNAGLGGAGGDGFVCVVEF